MVTVRAKEFPDRISVDGGQTYINATVGSLDPLVARYGDWAWDGANNEMTLMSKLYRVFVFYCGQINFFFPPAKVNFV